MGELNELWYRQVEDVETGERIAWQSGGRTCVDVGEARVWLRADRRCGAPEVSVEFSLPVVLNGHNRDPLAVELVPDAVDGVLSTLRGAFPGVPRVDQVRVTRLDLTRNFEDVRNPSTTLSALSALQVARAKSHNTYAGDGRVETVTKGQRGRWLATAYDKERELRQKALTDPKRRALLVATADRSAGLLRVELQLRRDVLSRSGLSSVDDIDGTRVDQLGNHFFERSRYGGLMSGTDRLKEIVTELHESGHDKEVRGLLAYLASELLRVPSPYSKNPRAQYARLARRLSLSPGDLVSGEGEPRRLDLQSGRELVGDAALVGYREHTRSRLPVGVPPAVHPRLR